MEITKKKNDQKNEKFFFERIDQSLALRGVSIKNKGYRGTPVHKSTYFRAAHPHSFGVRKRNDVSVNV